MKTRALANEVLEYKINILRTRMITIGKLKGFTHPDTIEISQELDILLNQYQQMKYKRPV